jgi:membrane fusion protein (multidrug efflux system)
MFVFSLRNYLFLLIFSTLFACNKKEQKQLPPQEVNIVKVIKKEIPIYQIYVGQVYGYKDIPIRARVDGYVMGLHFQEGGRVEKGQLLYTIDPQPYQAKVAESMGQLAKAKTELVRAENELKRIQPLAEMNAVSHSDLDAAKAEYEAAQASVEAAEAGLRLTKINLSYTRIKSPISGIIGKSEAKEGEYVGRPPNPVILNTVSRIDKIHVEFFITEAEYLRFFRSAQKLKEKKKSNKNDLELILADGSVHKYKGKLDFINRNVDPKTGAILVQASFPNPERLVRPGQYAKVKALIYTDENALIIPQRCVKEIQGKYSVYLVNSENKVENRQVKVSGFYKDYYVISEGLKAGEKVIIEGVQKVSPGMEVKAVLTEFNSNVQKQ